MSSEQDKPAPDAIQPGRIPPAGAGPAPDNGTPLRADSPSHNRQVKAGAPSGTAQQVAAGLPPAVRTGQPTTASEHGAGGFVRWMLGALLILVSGWGFIAFVSFLANTLKIGIAFSAAAGAAAVCSLGFFLLLEQNLWLSRFMGLRLGPGASPLTEALFFWFFGIAALLLRSTVAPTARRELGPAEATEGASADKGKAPPPEIQDGVREVAETIVFVVVLVLLLKGFLAEAFVIPTGSMAPTLYGYHREVECPQCKHRFPLNMSAQYDTEQQDPRRVVIGATCPNCFFRFLLPELEPGQQPPP